MSAKGNEKSEMRAILRFITGPRAGEIFKLKKSATIFGRKKGDVILNDNEVSSSHCQIQYVDDGYVIFDMNSSNGTYVNSEKIVRKNLQDHDVIGMGKSDIVFELLAEESARHISTFAQVRDSQAGATQLMEGVVSDPFRENPRFQILIQVTYQNGETEAHLIKHSLYYLGRASSFGQFDKDPNVSRRHLMVKLNDLGEVFVEDQGSTNGTFINGAKIKGIHLVQPTDSIQIGACKLKITAQPRSS